MKNSKKGFTLVELSIVLVIIGLLIGGILVAQSMIGTAKIQALTRQIGQFDAAVANFQTKFNSLPGDSKLFTPVGDGNGTITDTNSAATIAGFKGEIGRFWNDLSVSGVTNPNGGGAYTNNFTTAAVAVPGTDIPLAVAGTNAGVYAYGVAGQNFYAIGGVGGTAAAVNVNVAFKGSDVLALDTKIDDGLNGSGNVQGSIVTAGSFAIVAGAADSTKCAGGSATTYNTTLTTDQCSIRVRIGTSTGVLN